jgi:SAM-dependent methyltransferase
VLRRPANLLIDSATYLDLRIDQRVRAAEPALDNPAIAAKFLPLAAGGDQVAFISPDSDTSPALLFDNGLAVPPIELMEGYYDDTGERYYLQTGRTDVERMRAIISRAGIDLSAAKRILEFGCSTGRMVRHLADLAARGVEVRGVDISAEHVAWARRHLSPPFHFTTTTTFPHLPFDDHYFDFVFAGSVFTHIRDLWDSFLLELRRVTSPGGTLWITIHDEHCVKVVESRYPSSDIARMLRKWEHTDRLRSGTFDVACIGVSPRNATVFFSERFLRQFASREFELLSYDHEAYGYQTGVLLRRRQSL